MVDLHELIKYLSGYDNGSGNGNTNSVITFSDVVGLHFKRFGLVQRGLTGFDWIDEVLFDFFKIGGGNLRVKCVNRCGS